MTNREIDQEMSKQVAIERKAGRQILRLIVLAQKQKLCAELAFKDLADWLIRGHKMSERNAYRKLKAAKLSMEVPAILEKIEMGELSLSAVAQVQSAIQAHEKFLGEKMSADAKAEVIRQVEGLKAVETERTLVSIFPEIACEAKQDRTHIVTENISRLSLNLPNETLEMIQRARDLLSHSLPNATQADVIQHVFNEFLNRKDPLRKPQEKTIAKNSPTQSTGKCLRMAANNPASKKAIYDQVIRRARGGCEFVDHHTGQICGSSYQIQIDHIKPKAIGGIDEPSNLRCLCRKHNLYMAKKNLGKMAERWKQN